ncbi:MAG: ankyrin repeat domain-containing protein [Gammaproteobacteria bacterium]
MKTKLNIILTATIIVIGRLFTLPALAAKGKVSQRGGFNFPRALCVIFVVAAIGGCGNSPTDLHFAARNGDIAQVKRLIDDGADVNAKMEEDVTPLFVAALSGHAEITKALIEAGADINAKTDGDLTILHVAIVHGQTRTALVLIKEKADVDAKADNDMTPLHLAAVAGRAEIAQALIKGGVNINAKEENNLTPLHLAIFGSNAEIARDFIESGGTFGQGHTEVALALIKERVDIDAKESEEGFTPLHFAASLGKTEIVLALIKAGANLHIRDDEGKTALQIAIEEQGKNSDIALALQNAAEK